MIETLSSDLGDIWIWCFSGVIKWQSSSSQPDHCTVFNFFAALRLRMTNTFTSIFFSKYNEIVRFFFGVVYPWLVVNLLYLFICYCLMIFKCLGLLPKNSYYFYKLVIYLDSSCQYHAGFLSSHVGYMGGSRKTSFLKQEQQQFICVILHKYLFWKSCVKDLCHLRIAVVHPIMVYCSGNFQLRWRMDLMLKKSVSAVN